ncbi:M15 family peptidase [Candidatus Palauibacter sp.]|uniref:M15 family peptidase n=1 Tax=Candidatus Palauibacter sp. TaxID=3101350 RepID=UPI003B5C38ED
MIAAAVRRIQARLETLGHYGGEIDGRCGPRTNGAVDAALEDRDAELPSGWRNWSEKRRTVAYLQLWCHEEGIDAGPVDGWWGPQTDFAYGALAETLETRRPPANWRDFEPPRLNPNAWPSQSPQSEIEAVFGPRGVRDGFTPPLRRVECPWKLKVAWNMKATTRRITIHEACADSLGRILANAWDHYGGPEIERLRLDLYGGSYNPRKMRRGSRWSTHSWGIAIDWDPAHNQLDWGRGQASLDGPDYEDWWRFWEEEGWVSLGRHRNFDWMHVQAARL